MKLFPAIDLLGGRAVRLEKGKRDSATVFHERPVELVAELARAGADRLHVVDLDGAFGERRQIELVRDIVEASPIPVEVGGGVRDRASFEQVLALGAAYVVLGTAAISAPAFVSELCRAHPGRIIVAVDARDGIVATHGWVESAGITAADLGAGMARAGAAALLYTDIGRDGMGSGPNVEATAALARAVGCEVIASGGVGSLAHLAALRDAGIASVVVGRALYDRAFTIEEAVRVAHAPVGVP